MRLLHLALVAAFATSVGLAVGTAPAHAQAAPDAKVNAKLAKKASKATRGIVRDAKKRIKTQAKVTSGRLKDLAKTVRTGKGIEEVSGIASTPGLKVSRDQADALFVQFVEIIDAQNGVTIEIIGDAYEQAAEDPSLLDLIESPGTKVAADALLFDMKFALQDACEGGSKVVRKGVDKLVDEYFGLGYPFTFVDLRTPDLAVPTVGGEPAKPLQVPQILATSGTAAGDVVTWLGLDNSTFDGNGLPVVVVIDANGEVVSEFGAPEQAEFVGFIRETGTSLGEGRHDLALNTGTFSQTVAPQTFYPSPPRPVCVPGSLNSFQVEGAPDGSGSEGDPFLLPVNKKPCSDINATSEPLVGFDFFLPGTEEGLPVLPTDTDLIFRQTVFFARSGPFSTQLQTRINGEVVTNGQVTSESRFGEVPDVFLRFDKKGRACVEVFLAGELEQRLDFKVE